MQPEEEKIENHPNYSENKNQPAQKWELLTQKVYELELLISGAGIYLFSTLFYALDGIWQYYDYNFLERDDFVSPLAHIVYVISKGSALALWIGFILHFVLRAFWISMIGMMNIFPKGIKYENLPKNYSKEYVDYLKEKISPTEVFISAIDRACSAILLAVFLLVLIFGTGAGIYLFMILGYDLLKIVLGSAHKESLFLIIFSFVFFAITLPLFIGFLFVYAKRNKKYSLKIELYHQSRSYWLFGGVLQRLTFIVKTNLSNNIINYAMIIMAVVIGINLVILKYYQIAERKYFYTQPSAQYLNPDFYENMRNPDKYVKKASLQQDILTQPTLKIFLAYPKNLEENIKDNTLQINNIAKQAKNNEEKQKIMIEKQKKSLLYWESFFKIYINDSICKNPNMIMQQHPRNQAKGFGVYLHPKNLKIGKNTLSIYTPHTKNDKNQKTEQNKDILFLEIPFWYFP